MGVVVAFGSMVFSVGDDAKGGAAAASALGSMKCFIHVSHRVACGYEFLIPHGIHFVI